MKTITYGVLMIDHVEISKKWRVANSNAHAYRKAPRRNNAMRKDEITKRRQAKKRKDEITPGEKTK